MKQSIYTLLFLAALAAAVAACRHDNNTVPAADNTTANGNTGGGTGSGTGGGSTGGGTAGPDTSLCFERDVLPIFIANCSRCHNETSAEAGFVFTSYATITAKDFVRGNPDATELYRWITGHGDGKSAGWRGGDDDDDDDDDYTIMPPPPNQPLSADQIAVIRDWILRGAPNSTGCATNGCDTNQFTFAATIQPMLRQQCTGCHSAVSQSAGIALDSHSGVLAVVNNGRLMGAITHSTGYSAMPKGGNKLADCQIRQVQKWVDAGARND